MPTNHVNTHGNTCRSITQSLDLLQTKYYLPTRGCASQNMSLEVLLLIHAPTLLLECITTVLIWCPFYSCYGCRVRLYSLETEQSTPLGRYCSRDNEIICFQWISKISLAVVEVYLAHEYSLAVVDT